MADDDFAQYVLHDTWLPGPVAGKAGLQPVVLVVEQSGAAQFQLRFFESSQRLMTSIDYPAWEAARDISKVVTRTKGQDHRTIGGYILSYKFTLAGVKSATKTLRHGNHQLTQTTALFHPNSMVALVPIEEFLHHTTKPHALGPHALELKCDTMKQTGHLFRTL